MLEKRDLAQVAYNAYYNRRGWEPGVPHFHELIESELALWDTVVQEVLDANEAAPAPTHPLMQSKKAATVRKDD